jgi:hypothetical protein
MNTVQSWSGLPDFIKRQASPDMLRGVEWHYYGCPVVNPGKEELRRWVAPSAAETPLLPQQMKTPRWDNASTWPNGIPPMPPMDPLVGDKTPVVVEWFRTYWPEEFERRYKGRKGVTVERKFGPAASVTQALREQLRQAEEEQGKLKEPVDDKVTVAEKQVALSPVKTLAVCRSNREKRRDVEDALRANPQRTNREIARETGTTHPFVAKTRRHMETVTALKERLKGRFRASR